MAYSSITSSKKGSNEQIQSESHAHCFLRRKGGGPLRICTFEWCFLPRSAKKTEEKGQPGKASHHRNCKLHHDNATSHIRTKVSDYSTINGIVTISQPPHSPDLAPADYFLFPKVKSSLKGQHNGTLHQRSLYVCP